MQWSTDVDERRKLSPLSCGCQSVSVRKVELVAVSIVKFRRAKLLQDARLAKLSVEDIARAMATMAGPKALADYDAGVTGGYLMKAEALLELAIECAQERRD